MRRWDKQRWAGLIVWAVVLASAIATFDAVRNVLRDGRNRKGIELSMISLDAPLRAGEQISGRALLVNHTGSTMWIERAGNSYFWFDLTVSTPVQVAAEARTRFFPCGTEWSSKPVEFARGPNWWCFQQTWPLLSSQDIDQLRKGADRKLWFAAFVKYRTGEDKVLHARLCQIYNFEADRFERSRRESCDWFE